MTFLNAVGWWRAEMTSDWELFSKLRQELQDKSKWKMHGTFWEISFPIFLRCLPEEALLISATLLSSKSEHNLNIGHNVIIFYESFL